MNPSDIVDTNSNASEERGVNNARSNNKSSSSQDFPTFNAQQFDKTISERMVLMDEMPIPGSVEEPHVLPEIIHLFTKSDKVGFEWSKKQTEQAEQFKQMGLIEKYFFVSAQSHSGLLELKQYILNYNAS